MTAASVVIPTYDRWPQLEVVLGALAAQTAVDDLEIVVVSDGSTDGTDQHLRAGDAPLPVQLVRQDNQGPAAARNAGVAAAHGDIIVFLDDDVVPEPDCVAVHLADHERVAEDTVVIGPLLTPDDFALQPWVAWEQAMLEKQYDAMARGDYPATPRQFYTGNASLRRELFDRSGGFDTTFRRAEDVELAYRLWDLGARFHFDPAARAFHHAVRSYESWLATAHAYGRNDVIFSRDLGQEWLLPRIRHEFDERNRLTRAFTRLGLAAPAIGRVAGHLARAWSASMDRLGRDDPGRRALSAVYNLAYFDSVVAELGGVDRFDRLLADPPTPESPSVAR